MEFARAWRTARQLAPRLPSKDAVALWALFKQATEGDGPADATTTRGAAWRASRLVQTNVL